MMFVAAFSFVLFIRIGLCVRVGEDWVGKLKNEVVDMKIVEENCEF
jgi:hypothetical protein